MQRGAGTGQPRTGCGLCEGQGLWRRGWEGARGGALVRWGLWRGVACVRGGASGEVDQCEGRGLSVTGGIFRETWY